MKHARRDYDLIQDPRGLIPEDEPVFLIRAQDITAPKVLRVWADMAELSGADPQIVDIVRTHANSMEEWQHRRGAKIPDLPV